MPSRGRRARSSAPRPRRPRPSAAPAAPSPPCTTCALRLAPRAAPGLWRGCMRRPAHSASHAPPTLAA
eukprot:scaffold111049_cov63-Phaeocystis_antarctica.AAC.4